MQKNTPQTKGSCNKQLQLELSLNSIKQTRSTKFKVGVKVWCKLYGYCLWPAIIWNLDLCAKKYWKNLITQYKQGTFLVRFYGELTHQWVRNDQLELLDKNVDNRLSKLNSWGKTNKKEKLVQRTLEQVKESFKIADAEQEIQRLQDLEKQNQYNKLELYNEDDDPDDEYFCAQCNQSNSELDCHVCGRNFHCVCISPPYLEIDDIVECSCGYWQCPSCGEHNYIAHNKLNDDQNQNSCERMGLTPDWLIHKAIFEVFQLPKPSVNQPYIKGLLDPCTNSKVAPNIPAEKLYDKNDDGLKVGNRWQGYYVLLNPEYKSQIQWRFVVRAIDEIENGLVPAIILLCRNSTETAYFERLGSYPRVYLRRNSARFKDYSLTPIAFGIAVFCLAKNNIAPLYRRFIKAFKDYGEANLPIDVQFSMCQEFDNLIYRLQRQSLKKQRDHWVQCSYCDKWRVIEYGDVENLAEDWTCKMLFPQFGCKTPLTRFEQTGGFYVNKGIDKEVKNLDYIFNDLEYLQNNSCQILDAQVGNSRIIETIETIVLVTVKIFWENCVSVTFKIDQSQKCTNIVKVQFEQQDKIYNQKSSADNQLPTQIQLDQGLSNGTEIVDYIMQIDNDNRKVDSYMQISGSQDSCNTQILFSNEHTISEPNSNYQQPKNILIGQQVENQSADGTQMNLDTAFVQNSQVTCNKPKFTQNQPSKLTKNTSYNSGLLQIPIQPQVAKVNNGILKSVNIQKYDQQISLQHQNISAVTVYNKQEQKLQVYNEQSKLEKIIVSKELKKIQAKEIKKSRIYQEIESDRMQLEAEYQTKVQNFLVEQPKHNNQVNLQLQKLMLLQRLCLDGSNDQYTLENQNLIISLYQLGLLEQQYKVDSFRYLFNQIQCKYALGQPIQNLIFASKTRESKTKKAPQQKPVQNAQQVLQSLIQFQNSAQLKQLLKNRSLDGSQQVHQQNKEQEFYSQNTIQQYFNDQCQKSNRTQQQKVIQSRQNTQHESQDITLDTQNDNQVLQDKIVLVNQLLAENEDFSSRIACPKTLSKLATTQKNVQNNPVDPQGESGVQNQVLSSLELARQARIAANRSFLKGLDLQASDISEGGMDGLKASDPLLIQAALKIEKERQIKQAKWQQEQAEQRYNNCKRKRASEEDNLQIVVKKYQKEEETAKSNLMLAQKALFDVEMQS